MTSEAAIEKEIQDKAKTAPRITPAHIDDQILSEHFSVGSDAFILNRETAPLSATTIAMSCLTLCVLVMRNGFTIVGKSACASPSNFDAELGRKIAREDARQQIWALEGYQLRSRLAVGPQPAHDAA